MPSSWTRPLAAKVISRHGQASSERVDEFDEACAPLRQQQHATTKQQPLGPMRVTREDGHADAQR